LGQGSRGRFEKVEYIHVRRVANKFVDWLANMEVTMGKYDHIVEIRFLEEWEWKDGLYKIFTKELELRCII
jgi:rhamnogalacturonyl hydrolase YesR